MLKSRKIGVIGGGKMGGALVGGIIGSGAAMPADIIVADVAEERRTELAARYGVATTADNVTAVRDREIVILAVKPQQMAAVLAGLVGIITPAQTIISIAAGIATAFIEAHLGGSVRVVRVMPNTPALVGEGAAALAGGARATDADLALAREIFAAVGTTVTVTEDLMDAVTGLSGSGPAYIFLIIEALADGGVQMGLARDIALQLAAQTVLGSARLLLTTYEHPAVLKDMVTSPAGTTIFGLRALEEGRLRATLMAAVEAATARSRTLGEK